MSDFITMQNLIAKRIRYAPSAAGSDIQTDIQSAILEAINYYKNDMFWFNQQDADLTDGTVADQEYYPLPAAYIAMQNVKARYDPQQWYNLFLRSEGEIDDVNSADNTGRPYFYCIHNEQLRLSPIPDDSYAINMSFVKDLLVDEPLSDDTDTNMWMQDVSPMIRYRAQAILWHDLLRNHEEGDRCLMMAKTYRDKFADRTRTYLSSGWISPQEF
jgi:hypothetical protein